MNEDSKRRILARRAAFVAAAMSIGGAIDACGSPQPCLKPSVDASTTDAPSDAAMDASTDTGPSVCLSMPPRDSGGDEE